MIDVLEHYESARQAAIAAREIAQQINDPVLAASAIVALDALDLEIAKLRGQIH